MTDKIKKFIKSLDSKMRKRLKDRLIKLKENPYKGKDIKKLKSGKQILYLLRMGKIRIIFEIKNNNIEIIGIDFRGNIY